MVRQLGDKSKIGKGLFVDSGLQCLNVSLRKGLLVAVQPTWAGIRGSAPVGAQLVPRPRCVLVRACGFFFLTPVVRTVYRPGQGAD